jgi:hypothetical protein
VTVPALNTLWPASGSEMVSAPEAVSVAASSSVTEPVVTPPMTGASFVPLMVMVTVAVSVPPLPSSMV